MLLNGRPCTLTAEGLVGPDNDDALFTDLPKEVQAIAKTWIDRHLSPRKRFNNSCSSYGLKHTLQYDTGIYMTNNQFKDAMLLCGYKPKDPKEVNWRYRLSDRSNAFTSKADRSIRLDDAEIRTALAEIAAAVKAIVLA